MARLELVERWQTWESEGLKDVAESTLHYLGEHALGQAVINLAGGGERIQISRLHTDVGGLQLENPLLVGAGWDKKGRAVDGLYKLGFAGTEVGSVLEFPQPGNPRPRLFYRQGVALNRLGFNSPGMERVAANLAQQRRHGAVGISLGKNKYTPNSLAPETHAAVAKRMHPYADYFAINVASPNTPGLRGLLKKEPLTDIVQAVQSVIDSRGRKPLFIKTTVDLDLHDLNDVLEVCVEQNVTGIIDSNTTIDGELKAEYGWAGQPGGLSGDIPEFRAKATERMRHITREAKGTALQRVGAGGINDADTAYERMAAGAQAVQLVTAVRQRKARVARDINLGLLERLDREGVFRLQDIIGTNADC